MRKLMFMSIAAFLTLLSGCDISSSDSVVRNVSVDFSGFYTNNGAPIISNNSGANITALNLRQTGDQLEAVDNNNLIFRGNIGNITNGEGNFTLRGSTTAGGTGTLSGILSGSGGTGTLRGTWTEPNAFGTAIGQASITLATGLTVDPSGTVTVANGGSQVFTASGGSGSFSWSISQGDLGTLSATTGASVTYSATAIGSQTITATDGSSSTSVTITQQ